MNTELLVMAAGMGSRFGGLKQIEPIGPNGEIILDFSVYDAVEAGFNKAVFIIKKAIEKEFREVVGKRIEKMIDVDYVFQELDKLPEGYSVPEERVKPWGTAHAVLCAKDVISSPFAVINADDFYGKSSYSIIHNELVKNEGMCMVGYELGNTITENGTVSRGVCELENGYLKSVTEHTALDKNSGVPLDSIVSMNMWGLAPDIFPYIEKEFKLFLDESIAVPKSESFLPSVISKRIVEENKPVKVLHTNEKWYGVTYREDILSVREAMARFIDEGKYKF
ncbi:MAG: sugar phosphate nucleotidyltransferase [Clostridiales bacterium]|nr:sugar phosphate nucleotidyltransferase [Clostridiales bacterium]